MVCLDQGIGKGSCRSWGGINLFHLLTQCQDLLEGFGGHAMAAGFTVREENIPALERRLRQLVLEERAGEELPSLLEIDAAVLPQELTVEAVEALDALEPCGAGNPRPVLVLTGAHVISAAQVGRGRHLKLRLEGRGVPLDAIFFSVDGSELGLTPGCRVDVAFYPQINDFRGVRSVQLQVVDLRHAMTRAQLEQSIYEKYRRGEPLSPQEAQSLLPTRAEFVCLWRYLERQCAGQTFLRAISESHRPKIRPLRRPERASQPHPGVSGGHGGAGPHLPGAPVRRVQITLHRLEHKVDLNASAILRRLREATQET